MQSSSLVSVIIPTFEQEDTLLMSIESALKQTYPPLEVIVVDDGSRDNLYPLLRPYVLNGRVLYFRQENRGQGSARNTGAGYAGGEWLAFLDSDDIWKPQKLEKQFAYAKKHPTTALIFANADIVKDNEFVGTFFDSFCHWPTLTEPVYPQLVEDNFIVNSSVLVKRNVFQEMGGFDIRPLFRRIEDYDLWLRIASRYLVGGVRESLLTYKYPLQKHRKSSLITKGLKRLYRKQLYYAPWRYKGSVAQKFICMTLGV